MRKIILSMLLFIGAQPAFANIDAELNNQMAELLTSAIDRSAQCADIRDSIAKYSKGSEKGKYTTKDVGLNYLGLPRGLDYSIEGACLVLGQPEGIRNLEAAECALQLQNDRMHQELWLAILQLASGLGSRSAGKSSEHNAAALQRLQQLVGGDQAAKLAESLITWTQSVKPNAEVFKQEPLDFCAINDQVEKIAEMAEHNDFTIIGITNKLHHFSDHTTTKRKASKLVEGTVSAVTMFGPGFGTPIAAQTVGAMFGVSNGGSEESKLLKELYFQRQLESRRSALRAEARAVLTGYQEAVREKNLPLLVCSEAMLAQMVGAIGIPKVLAHPILDHGTFAQQTIANTNSGQ